MTDSKDALAHEPPLQPRWDSVATAEDAGTISTLEDAANALWAVRGLLQQLQSDARGLADWRARYDGPAIPETALLELKEALFNFLNDADDELVKAYQSIPSFFAPDAGTKAMLQSPLWPYHEQLTPLRNAIAAASAKVSEMMDPEGPPYGMTMDKTEEVLIPNMHGGTDKIPMPVAQFQVNVDMEYRIASVRAAVNAAMTALEAAETVFEPYDLRGLVDEEEGDWAAAFDDGAKPAIL